MHRFCATFAAAVTVAAVILANPSASAVTASFADRVEAAIIKKTNEARKDNDRKPAKGVGGCVDKIAEGWARHLSKNNAFKHNDLSKILRRCDRSYASENLARVPVNPLLTPSQIASTMVAAWMGSPSHRKNLLAKRAKVAAIGVRKSANGHYWVAVQNFADRS